MNKIIASNIISEYPEANAVIAELFDNSDKYKLDEDTSIYFGFPKFTAYEEINLEPDLLILSKLHGIFIIRFSKEVLTARNIEEISEELYSLLFGKLNESRQLRSSRGKIKIPIGSYIYCSENKIESDYLINSIEELLEKLNEQLLGTPLDIDDISESRSIIEGTKALASINNRKINDEDKSSKAYIVSRLENEIKTFDFEQLQSAITILNGPQRIRGLAGSGKTVVLAMKAAQIHLNDPDSIILITFYTKSLYQQIKDLITKFYRHYKKTDPNWDNIHIKHAWGGFGVDGVYYSSCVENGIQTISFSEANNKDNNPFDYVCKKALETGKIRSKYDYILIDEAQDLPTYFFRLIYQLAKFNKNIKTEKNIIWGYDDLQNIFNIQTKTPGELFGSDENNIDYIDLNRSSSNIPSYLNNDIVLHKCYRNPRSILLVAHSLGFGFYNSENNLPVQVLENKEHWEDLGYIVSTGKIFDNEPVVVERPAQNSPLSIGKYIPENHLIDCFVAENFNKEISWICTELEKVIYEEYLQPEDILIISLDDRNAKSYFKELTNKLIEKSIFVNNILLNPYTSTDFVNKGHITLSTVHRAKGNEAPVVFVIGVDAIYKDRQTRAGRNKLFTAFTRTKCCLKVSGVGKEAQYFIDEINKTLEDYPKLKFIQPSKEEVERLQRDLNSKNEKVKQIRKEFYEKLKEQGLTDTEIQEEMKALNKI